GENNGVHGDGEVLPAGTDEQAGEHGERDRYHDAELTARATFRVHLDAASYRFDARPDDVEADAASRDVGDRARRREARFQDEVEAPFVGEVRGIDAALCRADADGIDVDPAPVVGDDDDHFGADLHRVQPQRRRRRFARGRALGRGLDAVVDGVANEVEQGIG